MRNWKVFIGLGVVWSCAAMAAFDRPHVFGMNPVWSGWVKRASATWEPAMFDKVVESGATCVRIGIGWDLIEPEPGRYDFRRNDWFVDLAHQRGLEIVGLWVASSTYASLSPDGKDLGRWMPKEEHAADFERATRVLAAHYQDRITMWEFWNEANNLGWYPQPAQAADYGRWLRRAYRALKQGNPNAIVGTTGLDGCDTRFLGELYDLGYGDSFDAVVVHPYSSVGINAAGLADVRRLMVLRGDAHKPVWITEFGWSVDPNNPESLRQQAENIYSSYDVLLHDDYSFVTVATHHTITDFDPTGRQCMGLMSIDFEPRPSFAAYQECARRRAPRPERLPAALVVQPQLQNGGFETGTLDGWETYGRTDGVFNSGTHDTSAAEGQYFWGAFASWDVKYGGIKQRVAVLPGSRVLAKAQVLTRQQGGENGNVALRMGLDPAGGSDPISLSVVWSDWKSTSGGWEPFQTPQVEATGESVTLFIEHRHSWPIQWNQNCVDAVELDVAK